MWDLLLCSPMVEHFGVTIDKMDLNVFIELLFYCINFLVMNFHKWYK